MDTIASSAAFRLPTSPYPGLRPFLDHEALLLLGRGRQVREVIARLHETQFVAVIGGSGSGKSSLVRAGVVPELRGFGIPHAGDYWIPVICTPGTTAPDAPSASSEAPAAGAPGAVVAQTPITRLARKFSQVLDPADEVLKRRIAAGRVMQPGETIDPSAEAGRRRAEIATVFSQGAGFSRLVELYCDELPARGPARENARFLFVIDQFEELFHNSKRKAGRDDDDSDSHNDARILIEAVIDHFFNPHPRCYVILTMRSEHLADCAGYLELPDAINKSFYLVRRLDDIELRDAIVGPVQFFLRLLQRRGAAEGSILPDEIMFDEAVIERLLSDVEKITGDTDHLPLLQHVLARTWEAACRREHVDGEQEIPRQIAWCDLEHAVEPRSPRPSGWLRAQVCVNTLRSSLENWAQLVYRDRSPEDQALIDVVLRRLAFKDPNNGQYSQQHIDVDAPNLFKDVAQPRQLLRNLFECGFFDSVNYLFWDDENPDCVTLKVSHESFIRGWDHFRALIDAEAERFDEFVAVLRKCALWTLDKQPELLLEPSELLRLEASKLIPVFSDREQRQNWFRALLQHRDGKRLSDVEPVVNAFISASREQQKAREKAISDAAERQRKAEENARLMQERQRVVEADRLRALEKMERAQAEAKRARAVNGRNLAWGVTASILLLLVLPYAAFAIYLQHPVMQSAENFATARTLAEQSGNPVEDASHTNLEALLKAANLVEEAKKKVAFMDNDWMRKLFDLLPQVAYPKFLIAKLTSEPVVNGSLRKLLTTATWRSETDSDMANDTLQFTPVRKELYCSVTPQEGGSPRPYGSLFLDSAEGRGVFVPQLGAKDLEIALYAASLSNERCAADRIVWSVPRYLKPLLLFDARVRYMAVAVNGPSVGQPSVSFYSIQWEPGVNAQAPLAQVKFRSVVADSGAVDLVRREVNLAAKEGAVPEVKSVKAWREMGGIGVSVGGHAWRLFDEGMQKIDAPNEKNWQRLAVPVAKSGCARLGAMLADKVQPGFRSEMRQDQNKALCINIQRGNPVPTSDSATTAVPQPQREQVLVAVYDQRQLDAMPELSSPPPILPPPTAPLTLPLTLPPIASLVEFGRLAPGPVEWVIGASDTGDTGDASDTSAPYEGWIALKRSTPDRGEDYFGAPWSTTALIRLGQQVKDQAKTPASAPASSPAR